MAGLACARALRAGGRKVLVLERAREIGGRCATAWPEHPADFGVAFFHGHSEAYLAALAAADATRLDWPSQVKGSGRPCRPEAFAPRERRVAFAEGAIAFPRYLARGLDVHLRCPVVALQDARGALSLTLEGGAIVESQTVVLALAPEEALALLAALHEPSTAVRSARAVLGMSRSEACLALIAVYGHRVAAPPWHVCYPEDSRVLQLASNESSKRPGRGELVMLYQAHPGWSSTHLSNERWPEELLAEAVRCCGLSAAHPVKVEPHPWHFARSDRAAELAGPMLLRLPGGASLGLAGDRFAPGGGVEAAYLSGERLAARILAGGLK